MTRQDMASTWWHSLTEHERRDVIEATEEALGIGPGLPPPTVREIFDLVQANKVKLEGGKVSREP